MMNFKTLTAVSLGLLLVAGSVFAAPFNSEVKMKLNFKNEEITSMIETFAKNSKTTFVVDPSVRGKISVFAAEPVGLDEAFDLLSTSLALNGYAILNQDGKFVVVAARNATRSSIPTITEIKSIKPERMVTYIATLKHASAQEIQKHLRAMASKDGEMTALPDSNQILVTDFISSVNRVAEVLKTLDVPVNSRPAKPTSKMAITAPAVGTAPSNTAKP